MSLIDDARNKINEIDKKMVELFEDRINAVMDVLKYKKEHNLPVFDEKRELELIEKNISFLTDESLKEYYMIFLKGVLESSKKYQGDHYE